MDKRRRAIQKPRNRKLVRRYKLLKGCSRCGYKDFHGALHLHHRDPSTKASSNTKAIQLSWSPTKIKNEIRKCDVVCANCHAEIHWKEQ